MSVSHAREDIGKISEPKAQALRYRLFTVIAGRLAAAEAEHRPWPLRGAEVHHLNQDLLQRADPTPRDVLAHTSPEYRCGSGCGTG